ncbi:MAG: hypothetical protein QNK36_21030 [Colwellia sp.]|nr:hypothetical protein [Colwellia sp.]
MLNTTQILSNTTSFQPLIDELTAHNLSNFINVVEQVNTILFGDSQFDFDVLFDLTHATSDFIDDDFSSYHDLSNCSLIELQNIDPFVSKFINEKHPVIDSGFLIIPTLSICYDAINQAKNIHVDEQVIMKLYGIAKELLGLARISSALIDKMDDEDIYRKKIKKLSPKPPMSNADKARITARIFKPRYELFLSHLTTLAEFVLEKEPYTPIGNIAAYVHALCFWEKKKIKEVGFELPSEDRMKKHMLKHVHIPQTAIYIGRAKFKAVANEQVNNYKDLVTETLKDFDNEILNILR